ncbi:MAG TPA: histidinol-phosphate transaminase [Firmicutes bacterium]|nr:histidinol-phosphate transaminase [Bacillota bacterium]
MVVDQLIRQEILGITPYVPGKPIEEVQRELGIEQVIKLASNENPLGPSAQAVQTAAEALSEVHLYPDGNCYLLKKALASHLEVEPEEIIVGNGCDEVIKLVAEAFFQPGDEVIVADPTFGEYAYATQLIGARLVKVKGATLGHDLEKMAAAVTAQTKAIFICNPNNPTGTMLNRVELEAFLDRIPRHVLVLIDQAYFEYVADPAYPNGIDYRGDGRVLTLRTFSKIYGLAGFRVGYGVGDRALITYLNRVREPFNVNRIGQLAAVAALRDQEHVARSLEVNQRGKEQLYQGLTALGLTYLPSYANFILFATPYPARAVFQAMLRKGVIVRSADIFGLPRHIRVTIGTEQENERFLTALAAVLREIKE